MSALNENLLPEVLSGLEAMTAIRRDLHAHPELGMCEVRTAKIAADALRAMGCDEVVEGIGKTGVAAVIRGGKRNPGHLVTIALRADMDALPLEEHTGHPWASVVENRMHACGHDGHVAGVLLAAHALVKRRENLAGDVVLVIQPGEEGYAGAREMIEDGLFERFPVDEIYGVHCAGELPLGVIGFTKGAQCAAADHFRITVKGVGGHGARPHKTVDPVVASGILIGALQTIVSRSVDPMRPAVVTIASIHGGDPQGVSVVPAEVKLAGTTRCAYPEERDLIERRMGEICAGVAATTGTEIDFQYVRLYPPLVNHDEQLEFARQVALEAYGEERVRSHAASMGAEDFAFFLEKRPGCFPRVGIADETHAANHHHPNFDYNDLALGPTADFFVRLVEKRLAALQ
jgi:amidohydrolase